MPPVSILLLLSAVPSCPSGAPLTMFEFTFSIHRANPVPVGVPGEIYVGGDGLALGYINRPELTAERFVKSHSLFKTGDLGKWLSDGNIEYLGRKDSQIKIRGFRVEPGEIETVIAFHPSVKECAVRVHEEISGNNN